jgi:hypothetical protein
MINAVINSPTVATDSNPLSAAWVGRRSPAIKIHFTMSKSSRYQKRYDQRVDDQYEEFLKNS